MRKPILLAMVLLCATARMAIAKDAALRGVGVDSCADYAKLYQSNPSETDLVYLSWAQGFMSGYNSVFLAANQTGRDVGAESLNDEAVHLHEFCDQHPVAPYFRGVLDLYFSLPKNAPLHPGTPP